MTQQYKSVWKPIRYVLAIFNIGMTYGHEIATTETGDEHQIFSIAIFNNTDGTGVFNKMRYLPVYIEETW